jgi:thiol-disulfide isomerase/thioredoxin
VKKKLSNIALLFFVVLVGARELPSAAIKNQFLPVLQRPRPGDRVKEITIGSAAPDWKLKTVQGETVALSELRGQVVVLDFWANWCGPCRRLEPLIDGLVREYKQKPVEFFTMSIWPDKAFNPKTYLADHRMTSTFVIGDDKLAADYGIWGVPTYFIIDPRGNVSYIHVLLSVDADALATRLRKAIDQTLLKESDQTH